MAETVAKAHVAPGAAVGVDVELAFRDDLIDPGGILAIVVIEILPESRGTEVDHPAPIGADQVHRFRIMPTFRQGFQQVVAHKGGELLRPVLQDDGRCFLSIHHPGNREQRGSLAVAHSVRDIGPKPLRHFGAFTLQSIVSEPLGHIGPGFQCADGKGLQACVNHIGLVVGGPVYETAILIILPVAVHIGHNGMEERRQIFLLRLEVFHIPVPFVQMVLDDDPPEGVGADAVHPVRRGGLVPDIIEALPDHFLIAENSPHGHHLGMHVADPDEPVALHAIPQIVLHAQMHRIGTRLPNLVQTLVTAAETAQIRNVPVSGNGPHRHQVHILPFNEVQPGEAETAVPILRTAQPGHGNFEIPDGVVVRGRAARCIDITQRLADRLAQAQAEAHLLGPAHAPDDLDAALDFLSKVQQDGPGTAESRHLRFVGGHLPHIGFQEVFCIRDAIDPDDPYRCQVLRLELGTIFLHGTLSAAASHRQQQRKHKGPYNPIHLLHFIFR